MLCKFNRVTIKFNRNADFFFKTAGVVERSVLRRQSFSVFLRVAAAVSMAAEMATMRVEAARVAAPSPSASAA